MTEEIPNGLTQLESLAGRRRVPPPQNRKRPVTVPPAVPETPTSGPHGVAEPLQEPAAQQIVGQPTDLPSSPSTGSHRERDRPLRATQVYLDEPADELLRRCSSAGLLQGSRDVTNSGVIRYALARLAAQMTAEQIAEAMLSGDVALRRPGRRRL